jgi:deoxyribonuclease (pyrimidine dimer)
MTRINLVPPEELTDQHLFAEFREIKMIPWALARSIQAAFRGYSYAYPRHEAMNLACAHVIRSIPPEFTLNKGHVKFFYDKGKYLRERYELIKAELDRRGVNYDKSSDFDPEGIMLAGLWSGSYNPTEQALKIIRTRINEKISMKPRWYRYFGEPLEGLLEGSDVNN